MMDELSDKAFEGNDLNLWFERFGYVVQLCDPLD
jgi:hypothetical protein